MRNIKKIHKAAYAPIADLVTYRALPTDSMPMGALDPFLFLNHHGPQVYKAKNQGLPFGPHPHRGFETVTFILEGDIMHKDTGGHESIIDAGGVQWMTAGSGLIHAEVSSDTFKAQGGPLEILQLWLNLPAQHKMTAPHYVGLQKSEIPSLSLENGKINVHLVAGSWGDTVAPIQSFTNLLLSWITFQAGSQLNVQVPTENTIFLYVVKGELNINGQTVSQLNLVEFANDNKNLELMATTNSIVLFGHGKPLNEPLVAYGPFVMNTEDEIQQAYQDYQAGKFGTWKG